MDYVARGYVLNHDGDILLVKMDSEHPWSLPGGHIDPGETPYDALKREVWEELGIQINVLGSKNSFYESHVRPYPLPISIHEVQYEHRSGARVKKLEFWYFTHIRDDDEMRIDGSEIVDAQWMSPDDMLALPAEHDIYRTVQEVYMQNRDLLDLLL